MENLGEPARLIDSDKSQSNGSDDTLINNLARELCHTAQAKAPFQQAPDSVFKRVEIATLRGVEYLPRGMWNAAVADIKNPLQTAENVASAAAMAFTLKTLLPEGGTAGKLAGLAIGAYFTYKAAEPVVDAYKKAAGARTMMQLDEASRQLGDAGGSYIVNSAVAAVGYKIGSNLTDRLLTLQSMDGFADAKAKFYDKLGEAGTRITDNLGLTAPSDGARSSQQAASTRVRLEGSERAAPEGAPRGDLDPKAPMEVTVMLKSKGSDLRMDRTLARISQGRQAPLSDAEFAEKFGARPESLDAVKTFAGEYGLKVTDADLVSGRVVLKGTIGQFSEAFDTRLTRYESSSGFAYRGRQGSLSIPGDLEPHIGSVLGMDNRPQAFAKVITYMGPADDSPELPKDSPAVPGASRPQGFMPNEVADAYNFPRQTTGKGQGVAVIELGGGIDLADNAAYYKEHNLPQPKINVIEIGGAKNRYGSDPLSDSEVALDSQVIGAVAPDATQNLIFAPRSDKGFIDAVTRGTFAQAGEVPNSSISISWGAPEESWTRQARDGMGQVFKKAALKGISIFAASGDDGAMDRSRSGTPQVDFPAAHPEATGTGGTRLVIKDGVRSETAWNNHRENDASGGGVSQVYAKPDFQQDVKVPLNITTRKPGRGVPDVSGNADSVTGYRIRLGGKEVLTGGTSAVAPLYSALMMRINEDLGKPVANLNPWFYQHTSIFNDITAGDNNGYKAGPGWDAVTGWGSIDGTKMLNALRTSPTVKPTFGEFKYVGPTITGAPLLTPGTDGNR